MWFGVHACSKVLAVAGNHAWVSVQEFFATSPRIQSVLLEPILSPSWVSVTLAVQPPGLSRDIFLDNLESVPKLGSSAVQLYTARFVTKRRNTARYPWMAPRPLQPAGIPAELRKKHTRSRCERSEQEEILAAAEWGAAGEARRPDRIRGFPATFSVREGGLGAPAPKRGGLFPYKGTLV